MLKKKIIAAVSAICLTAQTFIPFGSTAVNPGGDVNCDGKFTISDVVMLQRYLMGAPVDINCDEADLVPDGIINAFDLCAMRQKLVENMGTLVAEPVKYGAVEISSGYKQSTVGEAAPDKAFIDGQMDFALNLLRNSMDSSKNTFISPYSAVNALAMVANGADGETRAEMEQVIGGMPIEELNKYLYTQRVTLPDRAKMSIKTNNSIWNNTAKLDYPMLPEFLQVNADYYDVDVFEAAFNEETQNDINKWCDINTNHMIPNALDEIDPDIISYLINTVCFEAEWEHKIEDGYDRKFTNASGETVMTPFLIDDPDCFISTEHGKGFTKYYSGKDYAFAAILPENGMTPEEFVEQLTPEELTRMLSERENAGGGFKLTSLMPSFTLDDNIDLIEVLPKMGISKLVSPDEANLRRMYDFSNIDDNIYVDTAFQKTHIELTAEGTRAAAVTIIGTKNESCPAYDRMETVDLNRPFVYMIFDTKTNIPIFMGILNQLQA